MESEIRTQIPNIDPVLSEYSAGYLTHAANQFTSDSDPNAPSPLEEAAATVSALLLSASGDLSSQNETSIQNLVDKFIARLSSANGADGERRQMAPSAKKLDQAIHVGSSRNISSTMGLAGGAVDLESANTRKVESRVDRKKLEKAERKLRAKQDRKEFKNVEYEASKLLNEPNETQSYEEFYMAVNPLQLGESNTKSKDIKIDSFDISMPGLRILTDSSLTLAYGRRYGLVGQNGIGKSTLLRALARREVAIPTHISILHVEQEITGDDTPALQAVLDADVWRKHLLREQEKISKELSELEAERATMADTSADAARLDTQREGLDTTLSDIHSKLAEMESDKAESRAASILAGLGFSQERQQFATKTFSGGWRMRLALARALFCEPDLLLLDEPSNMLDVPSITFLANYLQDYPSTVLVVSHDRAFLNEVATDIIHQHSERLDYYKGGNFDSFYATKEERRKTAVREYEKQMAERAHLQAFIDKFRYNAAKSSEAQSRIKKLEKMPVLTAPEAEYSVHFKFPEVEKMSPPIIQMSGVTFGYSKDNILLKNVDLDVQLDSRIGIVGPNGAGKTTALKLLIGALSPTTGIISQNPRLRVGFFAQHHVDALDLNDSAVGFMSKQYHGRADEEYRRHLGAFGITGMTGLQKMALLSGGQKSRVAFACLALQNPHILVLDEPSNHLDIEAMDALSDALRTFQGGVLMVSHDVTMLQNVCTSLWVCDNGTIEHFDGTVKDYKRRITAQANEAGVGWLRVQGTTTSSHAPPPLPTTPQSEQTLPGPALPCPARRRKPLHRPPAARPLPLPQSLMRVAVSSSPRAHASRTDGLSVVTPLPPTSSDRNSSRSRYSFAPDDNTATSTAAGESPYPPPFSSLFFPSEDAEERTKLGEPAEDESPPAFTSAPAFPESSSSAAAVAATKAALPHDTKDGSSSKDLDDGEPPPPYSEGSSPLESFTYVMASAGGPASIITQVSQTSAGPPINTLGGSDENITLELRGTRFTLSRDELLTLPEFVLLSLFPNGLLPDGHMNSYHEGDVYPVDVGNPVSSSSPPVPLAPYDPNSLQYMLEFFRTVAQTIPASPPSPTAAPEAPAEAVPIEPMHGSARDMLQDRAGIIVLREDLDFYAIPPHRDITQPEMIEVKRAAGEALLRQDGIFSGLRKSEEPGTTEQHLIEMLTAGGFNHDDRWGHRAGEPNKAVICSIALARLRTDIKGNDLANSNAVGMAQKLLLFWRKPARRCWWEGVELDNVRGVEGKLKVWIRRVWTLEMSVIGLR
ncbi:P-loop containing nucleoside triphosphate hydrolase protein [Stemphylium lycopersici]|uniref:P-loop containing nucleoside triphosphate hydrolase protein n=1 Tax=Stemphylium lycopersici TaxID=183478 RepID=A0A364N0A0_STELY|nr:translation initiation regulator [Stemphylium lycopersici]RAR08435.1 P-loop containing nucleoside triphosphate hydrolase protein [Stemphylium lycopersici]RAR11316.1 P-loop containing nucleoside triphosphate hydrolase protein [Stemphylium lycopersici]